MTTNEELKEAITTLSNSVNGKLNVLQDNVKLIQLILRTTPPPIPQPDPPTPEPPSIPYPHLDRVTMRKDAPIMEVSHYNVSGRPVLRVHKRADNGKRIIAKDGKRLIVLAKVRIDGFRNYAYRLISDQAVDGISLPLSNTTKRDADRHIDGYLYIQKRLVSV